MKANKIIEMSQEKSRKKVKLAMEEIQRMRNEGETRAVREKIDMILMDVVKEWDGYEI